MSEIKSLIKINCISLEKGLTDHRAFKNWKPKAQNLKNVCKIKAKAPTVIRDIVDVSWFNLWWSQFMNARKKIYLVVSVGAMTIAIASGNII